MRARMLLALAVVTASVAVFDWRGRGHRLEWPPSVFPGGSVGPAGVVGSAEWLAEVSARSAAATAAAYVLELTVSVPGERPVVLREEGAADTAARRRWRSVEWGTGGDRLPAALVLVDDDRLWLAPGYVAERFGLGPGDWIGASLAALPPLAWADPLPRSAREVRGLIRKAIGDAVVVGREEIRDASTTHLTSWVDDSPLDIWVDDRQRLRRVEQVHEGRGGTRVGVRLELFDYDAAVEIHPPAPDDVLTDDELAATMMAALSARGP